MIISITDPGEAESREFAHTTVTYLSQNFVTQHPVDNQVDVADHIQRQPDEVSVSIVESDVRFGVPEGEGGDQLWSLQAELFLQKCHGRLLALVFEGRPTLTSYALTSASRRRNHVQRSLIDLQFRQIVIAHATTVRIPPGITNRSGGPDKQSIGDEPTNVGRASWFEQTLQGAFGLSPLE